MANNARAQMKLGRVDGMLSVPLGPRGFVTGVERVIISMESNSETVDHAIFRLRVGA
ncbi:hypothetical protein CERZMDRAFT_114432 [Cercospora zeae-maydis SCOH1-5]|uniref:Uncharacterized protein n=1 Tax=Cercospora zeae-maydis SCOH1-5 TaxID=717836 RepID=A0A6A6F4J2_9PEZI|nr:hypothetical protein CERZMDRAFT_114432 [Cercospora zeae-maydis SCOH1-5]